MLLQNQARCTRAGEGVGEAITKRLTGLLILEGIPTIAIKVERIRSGEVDDAEHTLLSGDER